MKDGDGSKSISASVQDNPIPASSATRKRRPWSTYLGIDFGPIGDQTSKSSQSMDHPDLPWQRDLVAKTDFCE